LGESMKTEFVVKIRGWPFSSLGVIIVVALVGAMLGALVYYSLPALTKEGLLIYTTNRWDPNAGSFGGLAAIMGHSWFP